MCHPQVLSEAILYIKGRSQGITAIPQRGKKKKEKGKKKRKKKKKKKRNRSILIDHLSYILRGVISHGNAAGVWRCEFWIDYALKLCHYVTTILAVGIYAKKKKSSFID